MREHIRSKSDTQRRNDKGATLLMVAAALVFMLGMCALAIDLVTGYFARVQCQRAADAAALAGAKVFIDTGCTSTGGCSSGGPQEPLATEQAVSVAAQNPVMGLAPTASTVSTAFNYPTPLDPQITVTVYRDSAHGDPVPTFFAKIFGINYMNVAASATAEAYNPSGGGTPTGASCVKPFLVPNCDPNFPVPANDTVHGNAACPCGGQGLQNGDCAGGLGSGYVMSYYVYPVNSSTSPGEIVHPGLCKWNGINCTGGDIGAWWVLHSGGTPSQWNTIAFGNTSVLSMSASEYEAYITECAPQTIACKSNLNSLPGAKVGPTVSGIETLINAGGEGLGKGQDYLCSPTFLSPPTGSCPTSTGETFPIIGGSNNPYNLAGQVFYGGPSDSVATVVVYDCPSSADTGCYNSSYTNAVNLSPGSNDVVTVEGFMQIFIQDVNGKGNGSNPTLVDSVVMNITGCGGASGSTGGAPPPTAVGGGGSPIPIRLIHQ